MAATDKERIATLEEQMETHLAWAEEMSDRNDRKHDQIITMLDDSMVFQNRLRWTIGVGSTILGVMLMFLYHYLPWIWDALPKHGHTH